VPAVLLLHRAAGSRAEYHGLAEALVRRGIASLRLDLRACGESINLGRFEAPFADNLHLLDGTHEDVTSAVIWLASQPSVDAERVGVVAASYSGEAVGEALRVRGTLAHAYVMLSPGSFSDESIAAVSSSGAPWLFIRTTEESPASRKYIDAVFEAVAGRSAAAEIDVIEGAGHATHILDMHPRIVDRIADWLATRLNAASSS
jgi:alpha-beta hydrolase superfamily lysophospholipase